MSQGTNKSVACWTMVDSLLEKIRSRRPNMLCNLLCYTSNQKFKNIIYPYTIRKILALGNQI